MHPEGPPREEDGGRQQDLTGHAFPVGDWGEPAERLEEICRWVEGRALDTVDWYLRDRMWKRRSARALRLGAALAALVGAAMPFLELAGAVGHGTGWGYLALLLAAACLGADRFFGLTSGWMRDVATAQAVQRRLEALRFDWASESIREVLGPTEGTAGEAAERCLSVLRRFSEDVSDLVRAETADWMVEFRCGPAPLRTQALVPWSTRPAPVRPTARLLPPAARPTMPRQRPPEPPR